MYKFICSMTNIFLFQWVFLAAGVANILHTVVCSGPPETGAGVWSRLLRLLSGNIQISFLQTAQVCLSPVDKNFSCINALYHWKFDAFCEQKHGTHDKSDIIRLSDVHVCLMGCILSWMFWHYIHYFNEHANLLNVNTVMFVKPDTFVPSQYFRVNQFSWLLNRPLVWTRKSVPALFVRTSEISGLSEPGFTNHHCTPIHFPCSWCHFYYDYMYVQYGWTWSTFSEKQTMDYREWARQDKNYM